MGGVGTFTRQNRTLYVGRVKEVGTGEETEETVRRHFKEWGEIEKSMSLVYLHTQPLLIGLAQSVSSNTEA